MCVQKPQLDVQQLSHTIVKRRDSNKIEEIIACLESREVDLWHLRSLALTEGGLMHPELRRRAWPKLVGIDNSSLSIVIDTASTPPQRKRSRRSSSFYCDMSQQQRDDIDMIQKDKGRSIMSRSFDSSMEQQYDTSVAPSLSRVSSCDSLSSNEENKDDSKENDLARLIESVVLQNGDTGNNHNRNGDDKLHYYQGFHDVAALFLMTLKDSNVASSVLKRIASSHFREAMRCDFSDLMRFLHLVLFPLIYEKDGEMYAFLRYSGVGVDIVLPWLITWFCHDVYDNTECAGRIFDAFIVSHPSMPLYFSVALILHPKHRNVILSSDCEESSMHMVMKSLLSDVLRNNGPNTNDTRATTQDLIYLALQYMEEIPPDSLLDMHKTIPRDIYSITLFQEPPSWALAPSVPSDWALGKTKRWYFRGKKDKRAKLDRYDNSILNSSSKTVADDSDIRNLSKMASGAELLSTSRRTATFRSWRRMRGLRRRTSVSCVTPMFNRTYRAIGLVSSLLIGV